MSNTEFASASRGLSAYQGLARWAGVSLETVVAAAEEGRLGELVERRHASRPMSGAEALRKLEQRRYAPGERPRSPAALIGELRAMKLIWESEEAAQRQRDPRRRLVEILARQQPPWLED